MYRLLFFLPLLFFGSSFASDCHQECLPPPIQQEKELLAHVTPESCRLYHSLDCKGKKRALWLSQRLRNKNAAIEMAAKDMARRQKDSYPNQKTFPKQLEERAGQDSYSERYGD